MTTQSDGAGLGTIASLAFNGARRFGEATAFFMTDGGSLTFNGVEHQASGFAGGLRALGVNAGDRVLLYLPNSLEWVVAYHALARLGAVVVPVNIMLTPGEVAWIAGNADAKAIILPGEALASIASQDHRFEVIITTGDAGAAEMFDSVAAHPPVEQAAVGPDDLWTIGYTSGTTGKPRGAMLSHRAVFESAAGTATVHVRTDRDLVLSALPLPHVYGNIIMNAVFLAGSQLALMRRFDAATALRLIGDLGVTLFEGVPTMYHQMLASPGLANADVRSLTRCTVGGQTMPAASIDAVTRVLGCPVLELWGMTEVAGPAISRSPYWVLESGTIGRLFPGVEAKVVDLADDRHALADGQTGELWVRGAQVCNGYWRDPDATAAAFDDGWLRTGDIAVRGTDAGYRIVDRRKDMIITAGYNVYPAELEQVIAEMPEVSMVGVTSVPDAEKGELAHAYVVLRAGAQIDPRDVELHCRARLASYKQPRAIWFVDDLPKTSTGKIARRLIADFAKRDGVVTQQQ